MNSIVVDASNNYSVHVGYHLLDSIDFNEIISKKVSKAAIISDSNVFPIYGKKLKNRLENENIEVLSFVFPAGESSKNINTYSEILNFLAENTLTRGDMLIALGGGVVGDITGFAAATYLRGISYIQIPTTLLAMVDSSVGGKTAIDLPTGKNLVGAFYQPNVVLCDISTLSTLPDAVFLDGCAEVIKYAILFDEELFAHLEEKKTDFDKDWVIRRCISHKRDVVKQDEFDTDLRQLLNLGHTIGHSVEKNSNYTVSHGNGVAIGTCIVTRSAHKQWICNTEDSHRIVSLFTSFHLPTATVYDANTLYAAALSDKKRNGDTINLILPHKIGSCHIHPTLVSELTSIIEMGL